MQHRHENHYLSTRATIFAMLIAIILIALKYVGWYITGSLSLQASFVDSVLDLGASTLNYFVLKEALKPADAEHRFGHGKAEALAGVFQSAFIAGSALWLLLRIGEHVVHPTKLENDTLGITIMIIATVLTFVLVMYQRYVVKKTGSLAVKGDMMHYQVDFLTNIAVLISFMITGWLKWPIIDTVIGFAITLFIFKSAWDIGKQSLDVLMDHELSCEEREEITRLVLAHPKVLGMHDLRTRQAGYYQFIQMHISLNSQLNIAEAHKIVEEVEKSLKTIFINADILIHQDPYGYGPDGLSLDKHP